MPDRKPNKSGCRVCASPNIYSRGLCQKHYRRWKSKYDGLADRSEEAAKRFELDCLRDGWIKAKSSGGRPKEDDDPFDSYATRALEVIDEGNQDIDEALKDYRTKSASRPLRVAEQKSAKKNRGAKEQ